MVSATALVAFLLAVLPLVLTPGASFTLVAARGLRADRRGAAGVIVGTAAGIVTHALAAGFGLAALMMASARLYTALRLAGALYLVVLGIVLVMRSGAAGAETTPGEAGGSARSSVVVAYLANVLNIKAAAVYLTVAPQVLPASHVGVAAMLSLAAVHIVVMAGWLGLWAGGLVRVGPRVGVLALRRRLDRVGGVVLVGLGVRTALAR